MQRREAQRARTEGRRERTLVESDYLLCVYDGHRLGGLRFRIDGGPFLDDNFELPSPPWTSLRELEHASLQLERVGVERDPSYGKWLSMLIAPGRSLGGARPKASVLDTKKRLWIAKFPSANDTEDIGAWVSVAHALAEKAGVGVAGAECKRFGKKHHTFLSRRFDRTDAGERIHFASAMTMLERGDGEEGASYIDLAGVLSQRGAHAPRDLEQLWRRIVFFICISNVDDHLRNHGFLLEKKGWALAPRRSWAGSKPLSRSGAPRPGGLESCGRSRTGWRARLGSRMGARDPPLSGRAWSECPSSRNGHHTRLLERPRRDCQRPRARSPRLERRSRRAKTGSPRRSPSREVLGTLPGSL